MQPINKRKKPFYVERGDIYLTDLGREKDVVGSEQFGVRPAVVTSSNFLNKKIAYCDRSGDNKRTEEDRDGLALYFARLAFFAQVLNGAWRATVHDR